MTTTTTTTDAAVTELAESYKQWHIGTGRTGQVLPQRNFKEGSDRNYNLKNRAVRKFLQWEHQSWGINLGWTDDASAATGEKVARWFFTRQGSGTGAITYGETIAIGNGNQPSFIKYQERTFGINLGYSDDPHYEWKLLGGTPGQPVNLGDRVAIYNVRATSPSVPGLLRYFDRTVGGDIGWPDSKTWGDQVWDKVSDLAAEQLKKMIMKKLGVDA